MRGGADAVDAVFGECDGFVDGVGAEVGQFGAFEAGSECFHGVEVGCVGGQSFDGEPIGLCGKEIGHGFAAVGGESVPDQRDRVRCQEGAKLGEDADECVGVVSAGLGREGHRGFVAIIRAGWVAQCGGHRGAFPVEPVFQHRGLPDRRPAAACGRCQRQSGLVEEHDPRPVCGSVF